MGLSRYSVRILRIGGPVSTSLAIYGVDRAFEYSLIRPMASALQFLFQLVKAQWIYSAGPARSYIAGYIGAPSDGV
jgi:hypothetical protein